MSFAPQATGSPAALRIGSDAPLTGNGRLPWAHTPTKAKPRPGRKGFQRDTMPPFLDGVRCYGFSVELLHAYRVDAGLSMAELARCAGIDAVLT